AVIAEPRRRGWLPPCPGRCLGSILDLNFAKYGLDVNLHGGLGDLQLISDDLVRHPLSQGFQNCGLARREMWVWPRLLISIRRLRLVVFLGWHGFHERGRSAIPEHPFEKQD